MPNDWQVQQLRLSLFANDPVTLSDRDWKSITGQDEPDRATTPTGRQYSGKFLGGLFVLSYIANRADFILNVDPSVLEAVMVEDATYSPSIGPWSELSSTFATALSPTLTDLPWSIIRMAFGAVLILPTENRDAAYAKLDDLLFSVSIDPKAKELNYKINWPRKSKVVDGLELNRITTWSSIHFVRTIMQVSGAGMSAYPTGKDLQFVRLEIDHNTDQARREPFDKAQRVPIFEELLEVARENTEAGECK